MVRRGRLRVRKVHLASVTAVCVALLTVLAGSSSAQVTEVNGSAFGASASVSLFGGPPFVLQPTPTVTLPTSGGNQTDSTASINFQTGPAQLLTTGTVDVSTQGTTGAGGSVTSSSSLDTVSIGGFEAADISSTCTANEGGASGSTTITGGRFVVQEPDINVDGDEVFNDLPANPAPNTQLNGVVPGVGDNYTVVLNEQIASGGGITVNAAHFTLNGPHATGEAILGQSVCGVTAGGGGGATTTTVVDGMVTTTIAGGGGATTTTVAGGVTPTTVATCPAACPTTTACPAACPTTTACPTACPTTTIRTGALVRTGTQTDLSVAWAALALTLGALLLLGVRSVPSRNRRLQ
jgi:hypothetical protein